MLNFQEMIVVLTEYWAKQGCLIHQGYDLEVGAGTFNPATFLRCLGPEPYSAVYVEPSRRPKDGRYGENPNRVQFYHQMQVIIKPSPLNLQALYLDSLREIGLDIDKHDIRFVHDDWENPTIGAWGLGWEVWADGMEVTQFTYFQAVGGLPVRPVSGELTYGLERLAMYLQGVDSLFDLKWNDEITYGDIYKRNEWEWSQYNFHEANEKMWLAHFEDFEREAKALIAKKLPIPAYDFVMKSSHAFNIMDARGMLSVSERARYIGRIRNLARDLATVYILSREEQRFPLLNRQKVRPEPEKFVHSTLCDPQEREDFLLEIGCEELPATFVPIGMESLERGVEKLLRSHSIAFNAIEIYGTPRRLAVLVKGLQGGTEMSVVEKKGPKVAAAFDATGHPTRACEGFFRSLSMQPTSLSTLPPEVEVRDPYLFATYIVPGLSTRALLAQELPDLILSLDFPKKMRWSDLNIEFARPLVWIVALYGKEVVPFHCGPYTSSNHSYGHRQIDPKPFKITNATDYVPLLRKHRVLVDVQERKNEIKKGIRELNKTILAEERLMREVVHLVEWPFPMLGSFDPAYLKAPKEVLMSEMIEHQKYFPVGGKELESNFIVVSNNTPSPLIVHGHERALSPRLADGVFLYEEDLKVPLEVFNKRLETIIFQKELGSMATKVSRLVSLIELLHKHLPLCPIEEAKSAAFLCKADLASGLVGEFPELQGVVGHLYAIHHGKKRAVALAVEEHWMPRGEHAPLPTSPCGIMVSLADKIDNLLAYFSLGKRPTSSSDPYALRRQALGILKIILEHNIKIDIRELVSQSFDNFLRHPDLDHELRKAIDRENVLSEIDAFLEGRLRSLFAEMGFEKDGIEAVLDKGVHDIARTHHILQALSNVRYDSRFKSLLEIFTRIRKIVADHPKGTCELTNEPAEKVLQATLTKLTPQFHKLTHEGKYADALLLLTELEEPVQTFFEKVKVMDDDLKIRSSRLAQLHSILELFYNLMDFTRLQTHIA
ncbi:MAG: glycine--tRNA ligase subunit beta [Chlamydiales bacterium]